MGKGGKKNKKDKDAPKKAISAYFFYIKERRESITKEQPSLNNKEIVKKMSEEWNALSNEKKKPYIKKQKLIKKDMKLKKLFMKRKKKKRNLLKKILKKVKKKIKMNLIMMKNKINF